MSLSITSTLGGDMSSAFVETCFNLIASRKKMSSKLYQVILEGNASSTLLKEFIINRYPIKDYWTRNLMGIGSRIDEYELRKKLVENVYEEETGGFTGGGRHVNSFMNIGHALGISIENVKNRELLPETKAIIEHNLKVCNDTNIHFTQGVVSVILLMEGQPPIVSSNNKSMEWVFKNVYGLPKEGYDFFTHHSSNDISENSVSILEDDHTKNMIDIINKYCITEKLQNEALQALEKAILLRHQHFDAIYNNYYNHKEPTYRWKKSDEIGYYL